MDPNLIIDLATGKGREKHIQYTGVSGWKLATIVYLPDLHLLRGIVIHLLPSYYPP